MSGIITVPLHRFSPHVPLKDTFLHLQESSRNRTDLAEAQMFHPTDTSVANNGGTNRGRLHSASVL